MANPQKTLFKQFDVVGMSYRQMPNDKVRDKILELRAQMSEAEFLAQLDAYWAKYARQYEPFYTSGTITPETMHEWIVSYLNAIRVIDTY